MSLSSISEKDFDVFVQKLQEDPVPEKAVKETEAFFNGLLCKFKNMENLSYVQAKFTPYIISILTSSACSMAASCSAEVWYQDAETSKHKAGRDIALYCIRAVEAVAGIAFLSWLVMKREVYFGGALALLLALRLAGVIRKAVMDRRRKREEQALEVQRKNKNTKAFVKIDAARYAASIKDALAKADKAISEAESFYNNQGAKDEDVDGDILELFQDLISAGEEKDCTYALLKIKSIPGILDKFNISVENFEGSDNGHFNFIDSLDGNVGGYKPVKPAFMRGNKVIIPGLVERP